MRDDQNVRTTLDLDDDVLEAIKEIAQTRRQTAGRVTSDLVRKALEPPRRTSTVRNGVPILHGRPGRILTSAQVRRILEEEE
jgi:hypothetical protein